MNPVPETAPPATWPSDLSVIVLTGGASRRLGRNKTAAHVGGRVLLERQLGSIPATVPVVLVGPSPGAVTRPVVLTREVPAGSGPLAAVGAGVARVATGTTAVLAADMPFALPVLRGAIERLVADDTAEALVPVDPAGRQQPLCAAYRTAALRRAIHQSGPLAGGALRSLLPRLHVVEWHVPAVDVADIDTEDQLRSARSRARHEGSPMQEWISAVREALGVEADCDIDAVLDVARDAAHNVQRPAAPVTTYLMGLAVGAGADPDVAAARIRELAAGWHVDAGR